MTQSLLIKIRIAKTTFLRFSLQSGKPASTPRDLVGLTPWCGYRSCRPGYTASNSMQIQAVLSRQALRSVPARTVPARTIIARNVPARTVLVRIGLIHCLKIGHINRRFTLFRWVVLTLYSMSLRFKAASENNASLQFLRGAVYLVKIPLINLN